MTDIKGTIPPHIDDRLVSLTGAIVTWWGRIEGLLTRDLITLRQHALCAEYAKKERFPVSTGLVIKQWEKTRSLVFAGNEEKCRQTKDLVSRLRDCADDRNTLVHYFWPYGNDQDPSVLRLSSIKTRRGTHDTLEFREVTITVKDLDDLNERLFQLYTPVMVAGMQLLIGPDRIARRPGMPQKAE